MKVPFLLAVYTLLCTLTVTRATNPDNPQAVIESIKKDPEPIDAVTYIIHLCHYKCIVNYKFKAASEQCTQTCIPACLRDGQNFFRYDDASVKSVKENNIKCAGCHAFDDDHMSETTKVICTFPRREKASTESVEECRKRLLEKFTANPVIESIEKHLGSDPQMIDAATYVMHYCHYQCIFHSGQKPESSDCISCITACLGRGKTVFRNDYDRSLKSALEKNTHCVHCHAFDDVHVSDTTWVMCTYPHRLGRDEYLLSPEGIKECRKSLSAFTTSLQFSLGFDPIDAATYVMHYCHYQCIFHHGHKPKSSGCTLCITVCLEGGERTFGDDASFKSAGAKHIQCLRCHDFDDVHLSDTTWVMCTYPHRPGREKYPPSPEGVEECRTSLSPSIEKSLSSNPGKVDAATYVMHYCHYQCIFRSGQKPESSGCASCITACLKDGKIAFRSVGYDASFKAAQAKHIQCLRCHGFDNVHMSDTTWVMCTYPHRPGREKYPPSPEGVKECRKSLSQAFTTNPGNPPAIKSIEKDKPSSQTVDVGTYVMHYCHYVCIVHKENRPESEECTACIETCLVEEEKTYRHIAGYDKLVESAREKNVGCLKCLYLDHNRIYTTTEVMCGFPHRLENQFPASPEGVEECRKNLLEKATPPIADPASYATHLCHHRCIFYYKKTPKTHDCVTCMRKCRRGIKGSRSVSYESVNKNPRNKECITCNEFNVVHIKDTAMAICHYPNRDSTLGEDFKECWNYITHAFEEWEEIEKDGVGEVMRER